VTRLSLVSCDRSRRRLHVGLFVGSTPLDFGSRFFVTFALDRFRHLGHSVSIIAPKAPIPPGLDAGILHVAATRVSNKIVSQLPKQLPIVNRQVLDISKRRVSRMLVTSGDRYIGPVIVKSNANYAGLDDSARLDHGRKRLPRLIKFLLHKTQPVVPTPYRIYPSIADVPQRVWSESHLVVEKFIPEREGCLYCIRKWVFLGDADILIIDRSNDPIVKAANSKQDLVKDRVPEELVVERRRLGFDYGKFDYVMHEGQAVLLDANSTPGGEHSTRYNIYSDRLASGLEEWILARLSGASGSKWLD
jgi:hypothetical protein